mmetsp:Transcript_56812/g.65092  ORF Transcript_56812/g.65092 Transcript_56812/m.65092 type:complete len:351 (+) Transcript_56812:52-1104(+)
MSSRRVADQLGWSYGVHEDQLPPSLLMDAASLDEAHSIASQRACFLAIYLHNPDHESTTSFVDEWFGNGQPASSSTPRGWQTLPGPQELMWFMETVDSESGYRLQLALDITTFPCLVLCFKKHVVTVLQGRVTLDPSCVAREVKRGMELWGSEVAKEISFLHDKEQRMIREAEAQAAEDEQLRRDRALLEAFEAQEAIRRRQEEAARQEETEAAAREAALREAQRRAEEEAERRRVEDEAAAAAAEEALLLHKSLAASKLPDPPSADADPRSVVFVSFRFPSSNVERRFSVTDTVEALFLFAESHECSRGPGLQLAFGFPPKAIDRSLEEDKPLEIFLGSQRRVLVIVRH